MIDDGALEPVAGIDIRDEPVKSIQLSFRISFAGPSFMDKFDADRIAVHAIVITARPALVIAPVFGHAKLGVIAAIAVSRMMGDVVHRHALDDGSVLAHHEVRSDALSVARPAFDDVLRGTATFGVVQDDVFLVLGWFRAVR